jgi:hypothetical protein
MEFNTVQNKTASSVNESAASTLQKSSVLNTNTGFSTVLIQSSSTSNSTTKTLPRNLLTTSTNSDVHRPNVKQFMDATGLNSQDASDLLYGVIGGNTDIRNWQEIMASDDPVNASRVATNAMYNQVDPATVQDIPALPYYLKHSETLANLENFAITQKIDDRNLLQTPELKLVAYDGLILRDAGNSADAITRNAWLFGFDTAPLAALTTKAPMQLQKPMTQAAMEPTYRPLVTDWNESIDSFFKSVGADTAKLLTQLDLD